MGALACGARALCAYPSREEGRGKREDFIIGAVPFSCTFGGEVAETAKNLFLTINQPIAKSYLKYVEASRNV